jgi:hypothetical protein
VLLALVVSGCSSGTPPTGQAPSMPSTSIRIQQGTIHTIAEYRVGLMSVFEDDGAVVAQLSIFHEPTDTTRDQEVKVRDEIVIGSQDYEVTEVTLGAPSARGSIVLQRRVAP